MSAGLLLMIPISHLCGLLLCVGSLLTLALTKMGKSAPAAPGYSCLLGPQWDYLTKNPAKVLLLPVPKPELVMGPGRCGAVSVAKAGPQSPGLMIEGGREGGSPKGDGGALAPPKGVY